MPADRLRNRNKVIQRKPLQKALTNANSTSEQRRLQALGKSVTPVSVESTRKGASGNVSWVASGAAKGLGALVKYAGKKLAKKAAIKSTKS